MKKDVVLDAIAIVGTTCVLVGLAMIYVPLAWIAGGTVCVGVSVQLARHVPRHR